MEILAIYISPGHDFFSRYGKGRLNHGIESLESVNCVAGKGLEGDRFFGYKENYKGQVTFFQAEVADALREHLQHAWFDNSDFRRNIIVKGVDLPGLIGMRFSVGDVGFEGVEEAKPCDWMEEAVAPGARAFLEGRGGLRARILNSGTLTCGSCRLCVWESKTRA